MQAEMHTGTGCRLCPTEIPRPSGRAD